MASTIGSADGGVIQRWCWALVNNPVAERTADGVVLAIGANLAMGLLLALVYARYAEPRLHGPNWWRGMQFALVPWLLSLVVFLPLMGGGVLGMDIGAGLLRILKKLGPLEMPVTQMGTAIERWLADALRTAKQEETVYERAECLRVLCAPQHDNWTLRAAISRAEGLFKQEGPIQLMSGHKAKGLEFDTVFHLDPWRIPSRFVREGTEEWEQEMNVRYVVETRFKQNLFLIDNEGWT